MANDKNEIDFRVRVSSEGLGELGQQLDKVDSSTENLTNSSKETGAALDKVDQSAQAAGKEVGELGQQLDKVDSSAENLTQSSKETGTALDKVDQSAQAAGKGASEAGQKLDKVDSSAENLAQTSKETGAALDKVGQTAQVAGKGVSEIGGAADESSRELAALRQAVDAKTAAIRSGLQVEQSEIELQRQHLEAARAEQQARLQAAQAQGDEAEATRAQNALRQIEAEQLDLTAQAKRAESEAVQQMTAARREQLAAIGPLTQAQANELQAAENHAQALRVEASAADEAAKRSRNLVAAHQEGAGAANDASRALADLRQAVDAKTASIKAGLQAEQSEIELQRQHLQAARAEQQARLQAAQAAGDEAAATRALNALRQIEGDQLALTARAKRAEATAVQEATDARRAELAAIGPLNKAQADELRAAENHAKALRVEAAAADVAALRSRDLTTAHKSNAAATDQLGTRVQGLSQLLGQMAGSLGAAFTFRELVTAAAQMEQLRSGLTAVTGDARKAGEELDFVRAVAVRIGADVTEVGKAFLGLSAATRGTAVEGEPTRQVFEAVATAMGKAGKSSAETANALNALAQMASKGVVQSEELRGQLGEALPGALNAAAKGMGLTTKELLQMVEQGTVLASDLFPALTRGLNELYGGAPAAQTLSQEITNIKNSVTELGANLGEAGGLNALKVGAELAQTAITLLDVSLVSIGKTLGILAAAAVSLDFSHVKEEFAAIEREAQDKLLKAAQHNEVLRGVIKNVGDEALRTRLALQEQATATTAAGTAAAGAAPNYLALANAYAEVRKETAKQAELADKEVAAVKARGEAAIAEAKLKNDEIALRRAVGKAAADEAAALQDLAKKRQSEVDVLRKDIENRKEALKVSKDTSDERKKEIAELEKLIAQRQVDADRTRAQAAAAQANAKALGEEAQATTAVLNATQAATTARVANAKVSLSLLETQKQLASQSEQIARLMGNEEAARTFRIQQLELDVKITRAKAEVQRAEAEGAIAVARAMMDDLRVRGELTKVKEAELVASIKLSEAKLKEADAIRKSAGVTEQMISNLRLYGTETRNAADITSSATAGMAQGWRGVADEAERAADAAEKAAERTAKAYQKKWGIDSAGYAVNTEGQRVVGMETEAQLNARVSRMFGADMVGNQNAIKAANIQLELDQARERGIEFGIKGNQEYFEKLRFELNRLNDEINKERAGKREAEAKQEQGRSTDNSAPRGASASSGGGATYVSNITIDGSTRPPIRYADAESQSNGEALIRELANARGAAAR